MRRGVAMRCGVAFAIASLLAAGSVAQEEPAAVVTAPASETKYVPEMTFDVASVRESKANLATGITISRSFTGTHARVQNFNIMDLVEWAYGINVLRMDWPKNLPDDLTQARFNIEAKGDGETEERLAKLSKDEIELEQQHMMQALLAERFNLKAHWETRDAKTYELVVVKAGRMKSTGKPPTAEEVAAFGDHGVPSLYAKGFNGGGIEHIAHGASMAEISKMLAEQFRHPVTDKTGLTGKCDFDLKTYQVYAAERKEDETNPWPTLSGAILDQLGLKLVPTHGPIPILVVEHVEKPSEN